MTQDELKSRLHYDPETGVFTWLDDPRMRPQWRANFPGKKAGTVTRNGYITINLINKRVYAHRMAFLYVYGYLPKEVDHIDGNPSNNKIENLRAADRSINMRNQRRSCVNTSGKTGLCWDKQRGKWIAYINLDGKRIHNKRFLNREDAERQRDEWSRKYEFHENHGKE